MPRRQFIADLEKAKTSALPTGISNVDAGEDDGQIVFNFTSSSSDGLVEINALITDLSDYPKSHQFMIYGGDATPSGISAALDAVTGTDRRTVFEMLDIVSTKLTQVRTGVDQDGDSQMQGSSADEVEDEDDEYDDTEIYASDDEMFESAEPKHTAAYAAQAPSASRAPTSGHSFRKRIRADLRVTKEAGFKVGHLGHLLSGQSAYIIVSVRIAKLGISEEAMQAWQVQPSDYLTLLIQYPNGYKTNEELQGLDRRLPAHLAMRVVVGKSYKPNLQDAIKAFTIVRKNERHGADVGDLPGPEASQDGRASIRDTFISKPLNSLLQERLVPILRYRSNSLGWQGAEDFYEVHTNAGLGEGHTDVIPDHYYAEEEVNNALPQIVQDDHYKHYAALGKIEFSFPLLAMQFLLRHFVRSTEFCLVCHRKVGEKDIEAIKPYVCEKPLCLYQYMSLGFGPSIEYELLAQPYVVDLLISFCYNSASWAKLKDHPEGLSIVVPPSNPKYRYTGHGPFEHSYVRAQRDPNPFEAPDKAPQQGKHKVRFDRARLELIFDHASAASPLRRGDWLVLDTEAAGDSELHCRVADATFFPVIHINEPIRVRMPGQLGTGRAPVGPRTPASTRPTSPIKGPPNWIPASFNIYDQKFDELDQSEKCNALCRLLDTIPDVESMRNYLSKRQGVELKAWVERISPSALSVLRWIIASNRACIMQVDGDVKADSEESKRNSNAASTTVFKRDQERCYGMKDYMQFRFAMGAPDKEQRFVTEVRSVTNRLKLQYPTVFAWHGSPLYNWHMIIREGLHYKNVDHGRAYGDGVYHATDAQTSGGYSARLGLYDGQQPGTWPRSVLGISSAIALNEIANAPAEFTSSKPYYVVKQLDWIQTRYLFVQVAPSSDSVQIGVEKKPLNAHPQDPHRTPRGVSDKIAIPAAAIKSAKTARGVGVKEDPARRPSAAKKMKFGYVTGGKPNDPMIIEDDDDADDATSVVTATEDLDILFDEPEPAPAIAIANSNSQELALLGKKEMQKTGSKTNFVPGTLDFGTLPVMPCPEYANQAATRRLMREIESLQKIQDNTPLVELGWYIEFDKVENVYQWIVELHSFHTAEVNGRPIPLTEDMKKQNVKSIVLEMRFNKDFPYSPPYARVIRPRFLSLAQGGGGHIVLGGAVCQEMLTNTGWSSVMSMESVLLQIRMAISSEPFARLDKHARAGDYGTGEAADGYIRACQTHGWQVPDGFREMAYGGPRF